jgi:hypothetical protein
MYEGFETALQTILEESSTNISYQLTYDMVYRLCKEEKQEELLKII